MSTRLPKVVILGRTNVGKSTLFNALCGSRHAIVEDFPGVTRDRVSTVVRKGEISFELFDTGGLFGEDEDFSSLVEHQAELALNDADVVIVVFDALHGVHAFDHEITRLVRRKGSEVIWVANKAEKELDQLATSEFYELGIEEIFPISAAHRRGTRHLLSMVESRLESLGKSSGVLIDEEDIISVAIIGKPNVGKSSLVNRILGEERVIASDKAGTTRDAIDIELTRDGQRYRIIDTAGLRKKAKIPDGSIERFSSIRSLRAVARADVAVVMIDAQEKEITEQEHRLIELINDRGIPLILAMNKWDLVEKDHKTAKKTSTRVFDGLPFVRYAPLLFVSALTGKRCPSVLEKAKQIYASAGERVRTSDLNRCLERAFLKNPPPVHRGKAVKMFFATQVSNHPPRFLLFLNYPKSIGRSYQRYLERSIREEFPFEGVAIKLDLRKRRSGKEFDLNDEGSLLADDGEGSKEQA